MPKMYFNNLFLNDELYKDFWKYYPDQIKFFLKKYNKFRLNNIFYSFNSIIIDLPKFSIYNILNKSTANEKLKFSLSIIHCYYLKSWIVSPFDDIFLYFQKNYRNYDTETKELFKHWILFFFSGMLIKNGNNKGEIEEFISEKIQQFNLLESTEILQKLIYNELDIKIDLLPNKNDDFWMHRAFLFGFYSKPILKNFLYLFLFYQPNVLYVLLEYLTLLQDDLILDIDAKRDYIICLLELLQEFPPTENIDNLIDFLDDYYVNHGNSRVRLQAVTAKWLITGDLSHIKVRKKEETATIVKDKLSKIIKNPERNIKRIQSRESKRWKDLNEEIDILNFEHSIDIPNDDTEYILHIKFRGLIREVAFLGKHTLEDVHNLIMEEMEWDDDHLYAFYMNGKPHSRGITYLRREGEEPPFADEGKLFELDLKIGQKISYVFDFGDDHRFKITIKSIREKTGNIDYPNILKRKGKPPEQYPDYDSDDF